MEYIFSFITGGIICVIGQLLMDGTKLNAPKVLVIFVAAGAILEAAGIYQYIVDFAGSGAKIPLPGFGYNLAKGAIEGAEQGILEAVTGGIKSVAGGISVAIGWGYLIALLFNPKSLR